MTTAERTSRRAWLGLAGSALVLGWAGSGWGGSYLDRAALLLKHGREEVDYLRQRLSDKELALVTQRLAEARVEAARRMQVPKQVAPAHPHLLLVFEKYERAASAAVDGHTAKFVKLQLQGREEERIFIGVLKQLGWTLPKV